MENMLDFEFLFLFTLYDICTVKCSNKVSYTFLSNTFKDGRAGGRRRSRKEEEEGGGGGGGVVLTDITCIRTSTRI
jgi:hypothetical protein